jgi:hypothetical protein
MDELTRERYPDITMAELYVELYGPRRLPKLAWWVQNKAISRRRAILLGDGCDRPDP